MATIKELLSAMIDKINGNEDKIDNIKGVPEAFDSITMTNGTDMANLTMSTEKELLFDGEAIGGGVTSWNDLQDRPFEKIEDDFAVLMEEQAITFSDGQCVAPVNIDLIVGKTYRVTFDGVTYDCVCADVEGQVSYIGNGSLIGVEDTSEPFIYACIPNLQYMWAVFDQNPEHTISVAGYSVKYTQIDSKYIPLVDNTNVGGIKVYNFLNDIANAELMKKAVAEFNMGQARILWKGSQVLRANIDENDVLYVISTNNIGVIYVCDKLSDHGGSYVRTLKTPLPIGTVRANDLYFKSGGKTYRLMVGSDGVVTAKEQT